MFSKKCSTAIIALTILLCYTINSASALKCYQCTSEDKNCTAGIDTVKEYQKDCKNVPEVVQVAFKLPGATLNRTDDDSDCMALEAKPNKGNGANVVLRACISKGLSEDFYKVQLKKQGYSLVKVKTCKTELCNSSTSISAGILSLTISTVMLCLFRM